MILWASYNYVEGSQCPIENVTEKNVPQIKNVTT